MKERFQGFYATRVYLPFSGFSRALRRFSAQLRGKRTPHSQETRLPQIPWTRCVSRTRWPKLWEYEKRDGNVRASELGILSALAASCPDGGRIFEIGTFDGRTTLNLALNSPARCQVYTLDLPPETKTMFSLAEGERHFVEKQRPGQRYEKYRSTYPNAIGKIQQLLGDSAVFDYTPYANSCCLVFVDGSHAYDYAISDTRAAMNIVNPSGVIVWHDYGIWPGVTEALEKLEREEHYGLKQIRGTSLVYWKRE